MKILDREELMRAAESRTLTSDELLALKSRSFYYPILMLETCKGEKEADKRAIVRATYNLLRMLDTIEDAKTERLSVRDKKDLIDRLVVVLGEAANRQTPNNVGGLERELSSISERLKACVFEKDEIVFAEHFGRGPVLEELCGLDQQIRIQIDYAVKNMAAGMKEFLEVGEVQNVRQLERYCYYVAGSIGDFLTRLVSSKDAVQLNSRSARELGNFLQLTNIIKNVGEDYAAGRIFWPASYRKSEEGISHQLLFEGTTQAVQTARQKILNKMLNRADKSLGSAVKYVRSIPERLSGYAAFCSVPLIAAVETLRLVRESDTDQLFASNSVIKIPSRTFESIIGYVSRVATDKIEMEGLLSSYEARTHKFTSLPIF